MLRLAASVTVLARGALTTLGSAGRAVAERTRAESRERDRRQVLEAVDSQRLLSEAVRRGQEAEALARVARTLASDLDVDIVADRVCFNVLTLLRGTSSCPRLVQPDGTLRAIAWGGNARDYRPVDVLDPGYGVALRNAALYAALACWSPKTTP